MRSKKLGSRIKSWTMIGSSSLLVLMLALTPATAQTARRTHSPHAGRITTVVKKAQAPATTSATDEEPTTIDVLSGMRSGQLSATRHGKG